MEYFCEREEIVGKIIVKKDTVLRVLLFLSIMIGLLGLEVLWAMFLGN